MSIFTFFLQIQLDILIGKAITFYCRVTTSKGTLL